ncbi:MAG: hypothetical protein EOM26_04175 [Alphaproteobacteria bacterium]|nr:hypothetical protein [Alphaproteobacteria bacterium]
MAWLPVIAPYAALILTASGTCAGVKDFETEIDLRVIQPEITYDLTRSGKYLTNKSADAIARWKSEHEDHVWASHDLQVGGVARGGIGISSQIRLEGRHIDRYGVYWCPVIRKVEIEVFYATTIFVAKEKQKNRCEFDLVHEHELGHHRINIAAVKKYTDKLRKDLPVMISILERDYVERPDVEVRFAEIQHGLQDGIKVYSDYIFREMRTNNAAYDSPEEYERVSSLSRRCHEGR